MKLEFKLMAALFLLWAVVLSGCDELGLHPQSKADAVAVLWPTTGHQVQGTVKFVKVQKGVRVIANVQNLEPGLHGFHVHQFGDCRAPDGASAGGHFNPHNQRHGAPADDARHVGDLGNLSATESGVAKADDLKTQPTGGADARLACGVIGIAK